MEGDGLIVQKSYSMMMNDLGLILIGICKYLYCSLDMAIQDFFIDTVVKFVFGYLQPCSIEGIVLEMDLFCCLFTKQPLH